jgi:hypothetical protein
MYFTNTKIVSIFILFFFAINSGFANSSADIFISNNTKAISLKTAYERLTGKEQHGLQNTMIDVLQKAHIEQGKFKDILGTYRMSNDPKTTADNTERFNTSPNQNLSDDDIFSLAKELAIILNQESVAVFIPDPSVVGKISVRFTSSQPTINEIVNIIHEKLPPLYSQAFSIYLTEKQGEFDSAKVSEI